MKRIFISLLLSLHLHAEHQGLLVVFCGISGSGKSTIACNIAKHFQADAFLEPEADEWPSCHDDFSSLVTIRSIRTALLWKAWETKTRGNIAFVDTYYDKLHYYYLDKSGMEWLIHPKDAYFPIAKQLADLDHKTLPQADLLVWIDVEYEEWINRLTKRNRIQDHKAHFQETYLFQKQHLFDAVTTFAQAYHIPLITIHNTQGDMDNVLHHLIQKLQPFLTQ